MHLLAHLLNRWHLIKLQNRRRNLSQPFSEDSHSAYTYIKENFPQKKFLYSFEVKFIAPVYSESIIHNHIFQSSKEKLNFEVSAFVKNKIVAKGEIRLEHK